ncbi:acetyl-CoA C-acetyltransferase [Miltoncostaea marina]|uniref:acetyl-CoA C-acetyltransferase n=1 Tax=Miltoncostaea marina TaxID=2843215 RepID=UPI001C3DEE0F|nr:acetyl-CoA C-acetyltransferase [Miltoncostaea marina]
MGDVVIASAVRTPIGAFMGGLASVSATALGARVIEEAVRRAGVDPGRVDDVLMGNVLQAGLGQNPARQAALAAGLPESVPATTVNQVCGSGLRAVAMAVQAIRAGDAEVVVAGGMESMSRAPHLLDMRAGTRMGDATAVDSMVHDGLWCAMCDVHMGVTAENVAAEHEVSREDQDAFALVSQQRAAEAIAAGAFDDEVAPVSVPARRGDPVVVERDEFPRPDTTLEGLARLRPAFDREGTVTAGTSSGINDGAAAVVVMSAEAAREAGAPVLAVVRGHAWAGVAPRVMGMGPVEAVPAALARAGAELADVDLIELNEAFAAQSLAVSRRLGLDPERVNVHGGAIALGHPIGASGARVLTTLLHGMRRREARLGLASLCIGGGQGIAMVVERPDGG